jgi:Protein of unknown function (DUF1552)
MKPMTRKHLARRTFLRGAGAMVALPALDAMTPAFASSDASKSPVRLAFTYIPNGVILADWTPKVAGRDFEFTRILKPLEPFRQELLVLSGLAHHQANSLGDGGGDHARAGACMLTGVHPKKTAGADIEASISVDQIAAQASGRYTRFPSLEIGCEDSRTVGNCDSGYSCAYTNSISWRGPASPLPPETNPRMVFERLYGAEAERNIDPKRRAERVASRRSVLDAVREEAQRLAASVGAPDKRKLDEYLTGVREMEERIESAEADGRKIEPGIEKPAGIPIAFSDYLKLMFDLQAAAFQADLTRVVTLMVGREGSVRTYNELGIADPHHPLTHHRNQADWIEKVTRINTFHAQLFAYFLERLKATPDGDGSLLDHSMIVYASAISDGNEHTHEDLPVVLAGRGGGSLNPGRHIIYEAKTPMTNLYLSLLDRMGKSADSIGDSSGRLGGLTEV